MSPKQVVVSPSAEKELKRLQKKDLKLAIKTLDKLESGSGCLEIEKIKSHPAFFRIKAGNLRMVYYPLTSGRVVLLLVRDRKDAYRGLDALDSRLTKAIRSMKVG